MKSRIVAAVGFGLALVSAAAGQDTQKTAKPAAPAGAAVAGPKDLTAQASYCIGVLTAKDFERKAIKINPNEFARGLKDVLEGKKSELTDQQIKEVLQAFEQQLVARQQEVARTAPARNLKEGAAFLAANKTKPGVKTLPDGLQYKVLREGTGRSPKANDTVSVHYRGTLIDGTPFDSSYDSGEPATFPVNGVIPGWTEALQLMKVGAKWQLFIPSELAYKGHGQGPKIGPNAVLVFEVELLKVQ